MGKKEKSKDTLSKEVRQAIDAVTDGDITTALAIKSPVVGLYEKLQARMEQIEMVSNTPYKTGGKITLNGREINISNMRELSELIELAGKVRMYQELYNGGAEVLQVKEYPVGKISGYSVEDVLQDIRFRYTLIKNDSERKDIQKALDKLKPFFSKEDQLAQTLKEISDDIGLDVTKL